MNGGCLCFSQNQVNHNDLIDSQLSFSNLILSRCISDNYSSDSLLIALNRNNLNYNQLCKYLAPKTDPKFFKNITYSYNRINYLFDEKREVVYWMDKYNVYLRGLKNRFSYKKKDWIASSKRTNHVPDEKVPNDVKTEHVKEERLWEEIEEKQRIDDSQWNVISVNRSAEYEAQRFFKEEEEKANLLKQKKENQRIADSLVEVEQLSESEAKRLEEESAARLLAEEQKSQRTEDSIAQAEQLAEYEAQRLAEESAARLLAEDKNEEAKESVEETKGEVLVENVVKELEVVDSEGLVVEELLEEEKKENQRIADSLVEVEQLAEYEAQRLAEESAARLLAEDKNEEVKESVEETKGEVLVENVVEELEVVESEELVVDDKLEREIILDKKIESLNDEILKKQENISIIDKKDKMFLAKSSPIKSSNFEYTAHFEGDLTKVDYYYTIKLKSVSSPSDGLSYLSKVRDEDQIWNEYAFHLFKDETIKNSTKITFGKFAEKQKAEEIMAYLQTKNIKNPKLEKYQNEMKINPSTVKNRTPSKVAVPSKSNSINSTNTNNVINNLSKKTTEIKPKKERGNFTEISSNINSTDNFFTVQVGAVDKISSDKIENINLNKENLFFTDIGLSGYAINYGKYKDYEKAHLSAIDLHKKGEQYAYVTKYLNGMRVKISINDYKSENISENTITEDIKKLGYKPILNKTGKFIQIATIYNWDSHNFKTTFDKLEETIYFRLFNNKGVQFFVGPFYDNEIFIELRKVKELIPDAFVKTI